MRAVSMGMAEVVIKKEGGTMKLSCRQKAGTNKNENRS